MSQDSRASKYISINALNDLGSRTARRRFFWTFAVLLALTVLIYWLSFWLEDQIMLAAFIRSVSANLFSAALTVLIVYGAYVYFIHEDTERPEIQTLRPGDISEEIKALPTDTAFYYLWGRSATYFRAETLRSLNEHAQKARKTIDVTVLLPDPEIADLPAAYEDMVKTLGEDDGKDKLFINAVATSAACALAAANNRNLKIKVCMSKFLPSFRMDMSDQCAILTEDNKSLFGLKFSRKSQFFEMFRTMMRYQIELSRDINLGASEWRKYQLEDQNIRLEALLSLGFSEEDTRRHRDEIFSKMNAKDHRYK